MTQLGLFEGRERRDRGIKKVESKDDGFLALMREEAVRIIHMRGEVDSDDIRLYAQGLGMKPRHKNSWGAIWKDSRFKRLPKFRQSRIPSNHARMIAVWTLKG